MTKAKVVPAGLESKIAYRLAFLEKVTGFAEMITAKEGNGVLYRMHSSHTHIINELRDFGGFSFRADTGQSMFGGSTIEVWYHPGRLFAAQPEPKKVLHIDWLIDLEKNTRLTFDEESKWETNISRVIKNWEEIARRRDQAAAAARKKQERLDKQERRARQLQERARHLRIA